MQFFIPSGYQWAQVLAMILCLACQSFADIDVERPGLLYGIGTVEQVYSGAATIDVGDAHVIRVHDSVAVFRAESDYYKPIGTLRIAETYPTWSRTVRSRSTVAQAGDIVLFIREFRDLKTGRQYVDEFLSRQIIADSAKNRHSTERRLDTAMAMRSYQDQYKIWEGRRGSEIGFIEGASFANGQRERIADLLKHLSMLRRHYQMGHNSLPAAGPAWEKTMPVLFGSTADAQHEAAQAIVSEDDTFADDKGPEIRRVQLVVRREMFDRLEEEKNLVAYLVATILEQAPKRTDLWFQEQIGNSQFPQLAEEEIIFEQLRRILIELRGES